MFFRLVFFVYLTFLAMNAAYWIYPSIEPRHASTSARVTAPTVTMTVDLERGQ